MVLRLVEGFENRRNASYLSRLYAQAPVITSEPGRKHGTCASWTGSTTLRTNALTSSAQNRWIIGFALRFPNPDAMSGSTAGLAFEDSSGVQCKLHFIAGDHEGAFRVELRRGSTAIATSGDFARGNAKAWHYFQLDVTVRTGSNGAYELRHHTFTGTQTTVFSGSSVNLAEQATDGADRIEFSAAGAGRMYLDDVVVMDGTGSVNNALLTVPSTVFGLRPTAAGNSTDFTVVGAATNHEAVDDSPTSPQDGQYVQAPSTGDQDLYGYGNLDLVGSGSASVLGVQVTMSAQMRASGSQTVAARVRSGTNEASSAETFTVNTLSLTSFTILLDQNPVGPAAWTKTTLDAAQIGMRIA